MRLRDTGQASGVCKRQKEESCHLRSRDTGQASRVCQRQNKEGTAASAQETLQVKKESPTSRSARQITLQTCSQVLQEAGEASPVSEQLSAVDPSSLIELDPTPSALFTATMATLPSTNAGDWARDYSSHDIMEVIML